MSDGKKKGIVSKAYDVGSAGTGIHSFSKYSFSEKDILYGKRTENMSLSDGALKCVEAPHSICANLTGTSEKECFVDGETKYFVCGSSIYKITENEAASCIGAGVLTGSPSPFYKYGGQLYVADSDGKVIEVGENSCTVHTIPVPLCYTGVNDQGTTYTANERINILIPYVEFQFQSFKTSQKTPDCLHLSEIISVTGSNGRDLKSYCRFTFTDGICKINCSTSFGVMTTVRARLSDTFMANYADLKNAFFGSRRLYDISVNGESKRLCLHNGKVFVFDLYAYNNLNSDCTMTDAGDANVMIPLDDGYFLLSESRIRRMTHDEEGNILVEVFPGEVGCDIPNSVSFDENKIVFANSKRGIFCIGKYGSTGEDEVLRVSYNVKPELEAVPRAQMLCACGICTESKYYFFAGDRMFIWNWDKTLPICLKEADDELLLDWDIFTGISAEVAIGYNKNTVFFISVGNLYKHIFSEYYSQSLLGTYRSERLSPENLDKCVLCRLKISANINGTASLSLYFDGQSTPDIYTLSGSGVEKVYSLRLPPREFFSFSMVLQGRLMSLFGYELEYYSA